MVPLSKSLSNNVRTGIQRNQSPCFLGWLDVCWAEWNEIKVYVQWKKYKMANGVNLGTLSGCTKVNLLAELTLSFSFALCEHWPKVETASVNQLS